MRKSLTLTAALVLAAMPAVAFAGPSRDLAAGAGTTATGAKFALSAVDDRAGGDDGDDQGHVRWDGPFEGELIEPGFRVDDDIAATVLCVNAVGDRATIIANVTRLGEFFQPPPPGHVNVFVKDGGPGGEGDEFVLGGASAILTPPVECPPPAPIPGEPLVRGNIVVHDGANP